MALWDEVGPRVSPWTYLGDGVYIRQWRPRVHAALHCPEYKPVYRPMKYEYEGACENYDYNREYCIFCVAHAMSVSRLGLPSDPRFIYDRMHGW